MYLLGSCNSAYREEKKYVFQVRKTNCPYYKLHKLNKDKISDTLGPGHGVKSRRF
jgi:hypothetical protein